MVITYDTWLGDEDLVRFLERHFTYKTPHYYIEYADSTNAPKSIYGRHDEQETPSQIFYSTDFDPNNEMIKFLVIKAMETVEESGEFPGEVWNYFLTRSFCGSRVLGGVLSIVTVPRLLAPSIVTFTLQLVLGRVSL